jgi:peptide/nickel transport system permease protein
MALALVTVVFALPRAVPLDTVDIAQVRGGATTPAQSAQLRHHYGLDRPLVVQYGLYLGRLARGDLGTSTSRAEPVRSVLAARLPWTLLVSGLALALGSLVSYLAGVAVAWRRGARRDRALVGTMAVLGVVPEYATGFALLLGLGVVVPLFPLAGARTPFADYSLLGDAADIALHLALPVTALAIGLTSAKFLLMRNTMVGVLGEDYMVLARAKGLPERTMKYHHASRNAVLPFLTAIGFEIGFAVGGSIFIERVFAYPGVAGVLTDAFALRDYPLIEGGFLLLAGSVIAANLVVDLAYARLDPRAATG